MRHLLKSGICVAAICVASSAYAQEVTSSIRGQVTSGGAPVAGATVTVTHVPSGTTTTSKTSNDGTFSASGLRIGGPFSVKVSGAGYVDTTITEIQLSAGQPFSLPIEIDSTGNEIVVSARAVKGVVDTSGGPATVVDRQKIEGVASVTRDIRDLVRRDPFATIDPGQNRGVIIAGQNARLNKFSVDGVRFSDNFGLNTGGLPTARGPVSLDAIEQLSVKIAPFDIREGDFQGGAINVVLRSGTNSFHGSGFYTYSSDGLTGDRTQSIGGTPTGKITLDFESKNYGAFLSGPIIKDKLFFAAAYEYLEEGTPIQIGTAGFPAVVPNLTDAQISNVSSIAQSIYNYDTLGVQRSTLETDKKYSLKLDWNVTDGHRLSATYIRNDSANSAVAGFSSTNATSPALALGSNNYSRPEKVDSIVVQLNSDWSSKFHTELRGNYRGYDLSPVPFGAAPFSQVQVCLDPTNTNSNAQVCTQGSSAAPGTARIYFGPDQFRHFNYVRTKQYGAEAVVRWEAGDFSLKLNAQWQHLDVANAFVQNAFGNYYFDSLTDFQNRQASSLSLQGSITGNLNDVLASFKYDQYTFGGQVAYDPSPNLNLTAGSRIDIYGGGTPPPLNQYFTQRYGFSNQSIVNGKYVWQPRFSFNWSPEHNLHVRGGIGLFAGGSPDVFLGNSYSVAGVFGNSIFIQRNADGSCTTPTPQICSAALNGVNGTTFSPEVINYLATNTGSLALAPVNALDPKFHIESTWKSSLSVDWNPKFDNFLGHGWGIGGDLYYGWVNYAPIYQDIRLRQIGTLPDGRPRYASLTSGNNNDLVLTNSRDGYSLVAVARIDKDFDFGLSAGVSYTYQDVKDRSSANGTTASGTYGQNAVVDPNIAAYGTSIYQVRNSWKFHFDFDHAFFGDYKSRFSLFGEYRSGLPYSLTANDPTPGRSSVFGTTGTTNRYLLYVPNVSSQTADPLVTYDSTATYNAFANFVNANGLKQGAIIGKNTQRSPSWFKVDLHVDQEVPVPSVSQGRIKLFADVENFLNLLNKDWGTLKQVSFPYLASVVNVACAQQSGNNCTQYRYSNFSNPSVNNVGRVSLWAVRLGVKVEF